MINVGTNEYTNVMIKNGSLIKKLIYVTTFVVFKLTYAVKTAVKLKKGIKNHKHSFIFFIIVPSFS